MRARQAELDGPARGLVFQLCEALGTLPAKAAAAQCAALRRGDRKALARLGVRLGTETIYLEGALKRDAAEFASMLWAVKQGAPAPALPSGAAAPRDPEISETAYAAMGYRVVGPRILRVDRLERLAAMARQLARSGPFGPVAELAALGGGSIEDLAAMLSALSYRVVRQEGGVTFHARRAAKARRRKRRSPPGDSPFAKLAELRLAQ